MATAADNNFNDDFANDADDGRSFADQIDLQHYLRILRKHKWPISLFTAAVTTLAAYYAFTATPIYSATSTLLIEQQKANVPNIEEYYGLDSNSSDYYQTQFELLKSRSLAERVIEKLDLWDNPELSAAAREAKARQEAAQRSALGLNEQDDSIGGKVKGLLANAGIKLPSSQPADSTVNDTAEESSVTAQANSEAPVDANSEANSEALISQLSEGNSRAAIISNFMGRLSIAPVRKTKLVKISYESADPELAATVANSVGEQYITSYLESKVERSSKASLFLNERLTSLKATLDASEDRLIQFKEENGLVDVDGSVNRLNEQELLLLTTELASARSDLSEAQDLYREVQSLRGQPDLLETIPGVQADPLVQRVKIEQGQAQRSLDELLNRYGEKHPRVVDAKSQLSTLNSSLQGHVNRVVNSIEKNYQLTRQSVASIQNKLAVGKQSIQATGTKKFELDALEREVATNQEIYDKFFNTISEAKSADGLETANALISDYAVAPIGPVKPKKQLIIALAALASLVLSMLMAFLYEQMDDTIKSTNDIEGKLNMKLLGILPLVKGGMFNRTQALPLNPTEIQDKKGTFTEAVNTARTALCMDDGGEARKVIMVTSSVPGEGKSTASINLAFSLAQLERVLLVDCDMRRPTVAKAAGFDKNIPGLSNLITNTAPARECIKRGVFDGMVDVLPSGPIPDQPLELLSSKRFEKIIAQLSEHYDRIVIDSAPTQAVSDALVLSKLCDAVVYAVKSHDTSIELVKRGLQRLHQVNAPVAGVLITQVDIDKITAYGGDYYYQGYYDYYGYTEKGKGKRPGKLRLTQEELISIKNDDSDVNLDLDYGLQAGDLENGAFDGGEKLNGHGVDAAGKNGRMQNKRARGVASNAGMDDSLEFDMTTQIDSPAGIARRQVETRKKRFSDDLDII